MKSCALHIWSQSSCPERKLMLITKHHFAALKTSWKSLVVTTPGIPELGDHDLTVVYNNGYTFLATSQPNKVFFFVIFRLEKSYTWPKRERYTDEDAEALAKSISDRPVCDSLVFGEIWKQRIRASVVSLEEGVMEHWHHGRIVLAGDAAHKASVSKAACLDPYQFCRRPVSDFTKHRSTPTWRSVETQPSSPWPPCATTSTE